MWLLLYLWHKTGYHSSFNQNHTTVGPHLSDHVCVLQNVFDKPGVGQIRLDCTQFSDEDSQQNVS